MWIFFTDAFLSVVDKGGDGTTLLVRARRAGEIEKVFPEANVKVGGGTDYGYRARLPRERVAEKIAEAVRGITYPNFKSEVRDRARHDAYMDVWSVMFDYQRAE
ncbi:hypothetical protein OKW41_006276 [Paraburkholderia sp. UCT70]|uniref:hypothetical protein n=1 Tax=Paraburkholderia sp. UCT70 TaxID=2991068 RepID=UPI003D1DEFAF